MRLATIRIDGTTAAGRVEGEDITLLPFEDVGGLLSTGADWRTRAAGTGPVVRATDADFAPLVPRPEKVLCVGINYADHVAETGAEPPEHPTLFAKYSRCLIGAYDDVVLPPLSASVDWEVELGVVIGTAVRYATPEDALSAVAGYTIVNDVSMRDWQFRTSQFLQGKTFENSTPVGPFLVTPDEVGHASELTLTCSVDNDTVQRSVTSEMLFGVPEIVSYISQFITLVPGDLIATGTPAGVGFARKPPRFLADGQVLRSAIDGLGQQVNRCRRGR